MFQEWRCLAPLFFYYCNEDDYSVFYFLKARLRMDHTKLAIFLFIALGSVTTLGSPTTAIDDFEKFDDDEVTS